MGMRYTWHDFVGTVQYHSVRQCKGHLGIRISTPKVLTLPDSGMLLQLLLAVCYFPGFVGLFFLSVYSYVFPFG